MPTLSTESTLNLNAIQVSKRNSANQFSVAPMLDWTNRHCRYFHRQLSKQAWLYSEMVTTGAIIYGNNLPRFLGHDDSDAPVVLQLGGSKLEELAQCAQLGEQWGYSEINLNVGCPSDRVQNNMIGACLMEHPKLVADCVAAMKACVDIPITVKCRIGIDEQEDFNLLHAFIEGLVKEGVDGVIIHARKAWLQGLSPKENRDIPPLRYDWVHQIKQSFSELPVAINGGITHLEQAREHLINGWLPESKQPLPAVDGIMLGRAIYERPYLLAEVDSLFYNESQTMLSREQVLYSMFPYIEQHLIGGGKLNQITRHMLGLFHGLPGARMWRRYLSENAFKEGAGIEVVEAAYQLVLTEMQRIEDKP